MTTPDIQTAGNLDLELARDQLALQAEHMRPHAELMQREIGATSIEHVVIEQRRAEYRAGAANRKLIESFVDTLPKISEYRDRTGTESFILDDEATARTVQSHVVWWRSSSAEYVLGSRATSNPKWIDLLLVDARYPQNMHTATVGSEIFLRDHKAALSREGQAFSDDERDAMLDGESGKLILHHNVPGAVDVKKVKRTFKATMDGVPHSEGVTATISDDEMRSFDVYRHMNELAVAFGVEDNLASLYEKRANQ